MTLDELNALKAGLSLEREERVAEDDEIVQVGEAGGVQVARADGEMAAGVTDGGGGGGGVS